MRFFVTLVAVMLLGFATARLAAIAAQEGDNPFADLGLPEIAVTITEDAFEGAPSELEAGRYVFAVTNDQEAPEGPFQTSGAAFLQAPEGMTAAELVEMLVPPAATPEGDAPAGSPAAEEEGGDEGLPPFYYEVGLAGGPYVYPGETAYAVIDLTAGEWILWAEDPSAPQAPVPVVVSGEAPADQPTPTADIRIDMSDFAFAFDPPLTPGSHVIEVANVGDQPHFVFMGQIPDGTTVDDLFALFATFEDPAATPSAGLSFEDVVESFNTGDQSAGATAWYTAEFEAGTYFAVCFITDPETGESHAMLGMIEVIVVE